MSDELKPCPFCGGEPRYTSDEDAYSYTVYGRGWFEVECISCGFKLQDKQVWDDEMRLTEECYEKDSFDRWNTRHTLTPQGDAAEVARNLRDKYVKLYGHTPAPSSENLNEPNDINRSTPQGDAVEKLEEEQEQFRQYLCDAPELEDDPIMDYWHDLSMAINRVLEESAALQQQTVSTSSDVVNETLPVDVEEFDKIVDRIEFQAAGYDDSRQCKWLVSDDCRQAVMELIHAKNPRTPLEKVDFITREALQMLIEAYEHIYEGPLEQAFNNRAEHIKALRKLAANTTN
jgi:hypothetical protein